MGQSTSASTNSTKRTFHTSSTRLTSDMHTFTAVEYYMFGVVLFTYLLGFVYAIANIFWEW